MRRKGCLWGGRGARIGALIGFHKCEVLGVSDDAEINRGSRERNEDGFEGRGVLLVGRSGLCSARGLLGALESLALVVDASGGK
jgi:hypothetical protein